MEPSAPCVHKTAVDRNANSASSVRLKANDGGVKGYRSAIVAFLPACPPEQLLHGPVQHADTRSDEGAPLSVALLVGDSLPHDMSIQVVLAARLPNEAMLPFPVGGILKAKTEFL